jgi:hypothetical protein
MSADLMMSLIADLGRAKADWATAATPAEADAAGIRLEAAEDALEEFAAAHPDLLRSEPDPLEVQLAMHNLRLAIDDRAEARAALAAASVVYTAAIVAAADAGLSAYAIARRIGLSHQAVSATLRKVGR